MDPVTGRQEPRPHRLRIGLYDFDAAGALVRTDSVETDLSGARTAVPALAGKPRPALLLVNDEDLSYAKVRLDPRSEATVRALPGPDRRPDGPGAVLDRAVGFRPGRRYAGCAATSTPCMRFGPPRPASACC